MKNLITLLLTGLVIFNTNTMNGQGNVGIGTNTPNASAKVEIQSTDQGILIPRMTSTQRINIGNPSVGLLVYQTDGSAGFWFVDASSNWSKLGPGYWELNGNNISNTNPVTGLVNIQSPVSINSSGHPSAMLDINSNLRGILIPRHTNATRDNNIGSPVNGLLIYNTDANAFNYYNGSAWQEIGAGGGGSSQWNSQGSNIFNANTGATGVGTGATPAIGAGNGRLYIKGNPVGPPEHDVLIYPSAADDGRSTMLFSDRADYRSGMGLRYDGNEDQFQILNYRYIPNPIGGGGVSSYDPTPQFMIDNINNRIGIGLDAPNSKLHINSVTVGEAALRIQIRNTTKLALHDNGGLVIGAYLNPAVNNPPDNGLYVSGDVALGSNRVYPGYKLSVDGNIATEEVRVQNSVAWPDYVFEQDYDLRSLETLKAFIETNKHLPEVPSAKEINSNGIQLGEMQAVLLKKIEELTL